MPTTTAAQQRDDARSEFNSFLELCPSRELLGALGSKWVALVLASLGEGPLRYNAIARTVAGISPKMLTHTLRALERDGLVTRTVTPSVPVQVDYALTPLGRDLLSVVMGLKDWAEKHIGDIQQTRQAYDAAQQQTHDAPHQQPST